MEDRYNDEEDDAEDEIRDSVTHRDGSWVFDMGYGWCPGSAIDRHPVEKPTPGLTRSPGVVRVFSSLAAANAAATLVWQSLQVNHGFDGVVQGMGLRPARAEVACISGSMCSNMKMDMKMRAMISKKLSKRLMQR